MNFFERQDDARKRTGRLVILFSLAVIGVIAAVYFAAMFGFRITATQPDSQTGYYDPNAIGASWWNTKVFLICAGITGTVILLGSLTKIATLSQGGPKVAQLMGGRPVAPDTGDAAERRLINVVEEMSIASGVPVPMLYVMDHERGINAFAAGWTPTDAAIGVTRGCLDQLDRDELQGVIAHEFSHILNGDMRLNIRLMGVLNGILVIGLIGFWILRSLTFSGGSRNRNQGAAIFAMVAAGVAAVVIGYVGVFFGNLIKAGVSRQREFLADASAVQFTRNPRGISGALKKIGGYSDGSEMRGRHAEEASHMFFGASMSHRFLTLLATHPPLEERIKAIDATFDGKFERLGPRFDANAPAGVPGFARAGASGLAGGAAPLAPAPAASAPAETAAAPSAAAPERLRADPERIVASIGTPTPGHVAYSAALLDSFPDEVRKATRETEGAQAVVFALLLDRDKAVRDNQLAAVKAGASEDVSARLLSVGPLVMGLGARARLPLVDLCLPALRRLGPNEIATFGSLVETLVETDGRVTLFEFTLRKVLMRHLLAAHADVPRAVVQFYAMTGVADEAIATLATLAYAGHASVADARHAYEVAVPKLGLPGTPAMPGKALCTMATFDAALTKLNAASPGVKQRLLLAAAHCAAADGEVGIEEAELLRAIADSLDSPMPPFLDA
jgi:Zn-dependent protease with chaperone function